MERPPQDDFATTRSTLPPRGVRTKTRTALLLAAITLFALALRWTGVGFELPQIPQVDEQVLYRQLWIERGVEPPAHKRNIPFAYPTLIARGLALAIPQKVEPVESAATTSAHLARAARDVVDMRYVLALLSACAVPLVFVFARRFVADGIALFAALWLAVSILHGWYSTQARPHGVLCTLTLLAVLASIEMRRRADLRSYLLAGLATGLAAGALQSGLFVLPAFCAAHVLRTREGASDADSNRRSSARTRAFRAWSWFALSSVIVLACLAFFYRHAGSATAPEATTATTGFFAQFLHKMHGIEASDFGGQGFAEMLVALWNYDPILGVLALGGVLVLVVRALRGRDVLAGARGRDILVVLAHAVPHVVAFGLFARTFQRFLMPLVPYLCLLAAWFLFGAARSLLSKRSKSISRSAFAIGVLSVPTLAETYTACKVAWLRRAPDTATSAARWIEAHADREKDRIALSPTLELPLLRTAETVPEYLGRDALAFALWTDYQLALSEDARRGLAYDMPQIPLHIPKQREALNREPAKFLLDLKARYVVLEVVHDDRRAILRILRDEARRHGHLVARFAGRARASEDDVPLLYQFDGPLAPDEFIAWRIATYSALGSDIEIYELDAR